MNASCNIPRALTGRVSADANPEQLFRNLQAGLDTFKAQHNERLGNIEAAMNASLNGNFTFTGHGAGASWGDQVAASDDLKAFVHAAGKGRIQIDLSPQAAITSIGTSAGPLIQPERADAVFMPRRRLTVRGLLGAGNTGSNMVEYPRQNVRDNQAATVAEGALKPESTTALRWHRRRSRPLPTGLPSRGRRWTTPGRSRRSSTANSASASR